MHMHVCIQCAALTSFKRNPTSERTLLSNIAFILEIPQLSNLSEVKALTESAEELSRRTVHVLLLACSAAVEHIVFHQLHATRLSQCSASGRRHV